ncbi:MAG: hypothetical protein KBG54_02050 [Oscillospiraceae bacterium]|nr:hypothetical protein [Oscillospiraceae bacterium]
MLNGVMLIIVTMFAVLGAYFLSDVLTACIFRGNDIPRAVVLLSTGSLEQMWNGVLEVRQKNPDCEVIILCTGAVDEKARLEPSMRGVSFATPDTLGVTLCTRLHLQTVHNPV